MNFDYVEFSKNMSAQAREFIPADISTADREYIVNIVANYTSLAGEAMARDTSVCFTAEQIIFVSQSIAEWSFHKSIDLVRSGINSKYWDDILQKCAFTVFEVVKNGCMKSIPQDVIIDATEKQLSKVYEELLNELYNDGKIEAEEVLQNALSQSNIQEMAKKYEENPNFIFHFSVDTSKTSSNRCCKKNNLKTSLKTICRDIFDFISIHKVKIFFVILIIVFVSVFCINRSVLLRIISEYKHFLLQFILVTVGVIITGLYCFKKIMAMRIQKALERLEKVRQNFDELTNPERQIDKLGVDTLCIKIGGGLLPIADPDNEGELLAKISALRHKLTDTLGYVIPNVRVFDDAELEPFEYSICVRGNKVGGGFVYPQHVMVSGNILDNSGNEAVKENSIVSTHPITNEVIYWINSNIANALGLNGFKPDDVIIECLRKIVVKHVDKIFTTSFLYKYLEHAKKWDGVDYVINELFEKFNIEEIRKVLVSLLEEKVSIKDIVYVFERMLAYSTEYNDINDIVDCIRMDFFESISVQNSEQGILYFIQLSEKSDDKLANVVCNSLGYRHLDLPVDVADSFLSHLLSMLAELGEDYGNSLKLTILCKPKTRRALYKFLSEHNIDLPVMTYLEISKSISVNIVAVI